MCIFREALNGEAEVRLDSHKVMVKPLGRGRFREEWNYVILIDGEELCRAKYFMGRGFYRPWIELYRFSDKWSIVRSKRGLLIRLFRLIGECLRPGESLFVEYVHDPELTKEIEREPDPANTFLGSILLEAGYSRLKDWYIPEGMWEGGQKIEASKV